MKIKLKKQDEEVVKTSLTLRVKAVNAVKKYNEKHPEHPINMSEIVSMLLLGYVKDLNRK